MTPTNNLRYRSKESCNGKAKNGHAVPPKEEVDPEFTIRESPLTVLIEDCLHIRAIYHIFVVILLMLFFDTVIYDLVERGKINIGLTVIVNGFGDIRRGALLWLFEFSMALLLYPAIKLYTAIAKPINKYPDEGTLSVSNTIDEPHYEAKAFLDKDSNKKEANNYFHCLRVQLLDTGVLCLQLLSPIMARQALVILGIIGLVFLEGALIGVPIWKLSQKHLELASSITVTCEMFRLAMKIHAAAIAWAPRCFGNGPPLPTFSHYVYFLFAPTLVYRDQYPRTKKTRWDIVVFRFLEVAAIIFYNSFLWERFILPYWSDYGKQERIEAGTVVRGMFACVLPGVISFLCGFYCVLQAWLNAFAEILRFGDRLFYEDWWTTSRFSRYYRAWNRVVHSWLRNHIYKPLAPRTGRVFSTFFVFFISALAHEIILALSFGFFYPVLMMEFGVFGVLLLPLTSSSGRRFPNMFNLFMWLSFFFGNGLLWSLYPMEYYARKNCPPSENDSFFIPKSWSCPEIILKPNWTFQNPLNIIY